ncbi:hypothetical protein OIU76_016903 [Salix suchowensis]|uniref:Uncharacterized protein n=1 Tax=Salix koriyanagi TaxID=2511006 RepID=A0A9Q1A3Z3_9ROSI|nr:hypothetical protein OIU76_016903 [Salix suchowensis]KAJ6757094.1 hypothetical protein OIU74_026361 [Salix koriyanagi]
MTSRGRDEEEEEAEVEERVVGGFREASSKAETSLEDPIHFLFPVSDRSGFLEGKKPDEVGGDVTVAEENGKCLYRSEEVKEIEEMEKMEEWFCVWLPTIANYFLHWGIK